MAILCGLALIRLPGRQKIAHWIMTAGLSWIIVAGFLQIGNVMILPLEERFGTRMLPTPEGPIAGIIILGGFEDGWVSSGRGGLAVNESAERLTEGLRLARHLPQAKVVFTGGATELIGGQDTAAPVRDYLLDSGIAAERIVIEQKSRNTFENAVFTRDLVKPQNGDRWIIVTSAYHMPRAIGVFRQAGFNVTAYPVDFRTRDTGDLLRPFGSIAAGLERADLATKEWIGLFAYRLSGRSDSLFSAP